MLSGKIKGTLRIVTALKKATTSDSPKMKKQEKISEESVEHFLTVIDCFCHNEFDNNWDKQSFKKAVEYTKEWVKYRLPKKLK